MSDNTSPNTLGLAFDQLKIDSEQPPQTTATEKPEQNEPAQSSVPSGDDNLQPTDASVSDKKKPYVNPERVKTGGAQRDKITEDELTERMARIKEQNEKIKQRRLDVEADEAAFRKMQESERAKVALNKKVQENVNRTREQNAKRKMDKIQSREWDSGKPAGDWKRSAEFNVELQSHEADQPQPSQNVDAAGSKWHRGGARGRSPRGGNRGRGRGRGRPTNPTDPPLAESNVADDTTPESVHEPAVVS